MRRGTTIHVSPTDRRRLEAVVADRNSPQKHVWRAKAVLAAADGHGTTAIGRRAGLSRPSVRRWRERFAQEGVAGLLRDRTRKPGTPPLPPAVVDRVVELTLAEPPGEATRWTGRMMARAVGISLRSVQRIWAAHRLAPHRVRAFKLSRDPAFVPKLRDVVGLYMHPPAHAIVLSVDEKSQIQALERTQPGLPPKEGRPATATHDYERHGTTTLFAALNVLDGTVLGRCMQRHPRWTFHFVPTSCSWLNAVETFFAKLTNRRLRRGTFHSLVALQEAINRFVEEHNRDPRPFVWTADPDAIVEKVRRGYHALAAVAQQAG
jgi:transposase